LEDPVRIVLMLNCYLLVKEPGAVPRAVGRVKKPLAPPETAPAFSETHQVIMLTHWKLTEMPAGKFDYNLET
jgi:hypothetical protein